MSKKESDSEKRKGTFGAALRLPVARQYVWPQSRGKMMLYGGVAAAILAAYFIFLSGVSKGPLSSAHSSLERDCTACHTRFKAVTSEKCTTCHEKAGDGRGTYSLASHFLYRSGDANRLHQKAHAQIACFACHPEHGGRNAPITHVPDAICARCHAITSFESDHPDFDFLIKRLPDDANLEFTHVRHVREIMQRDKTADVEKACLACHRPRPDGRNFDAISFDSACASCHMTSGTRTAALPVVNPANPAQPGVETLDMIRAAARPDSYWVESVSPVAFRSRGDTVIKSPLRHKDPWIMDNLRRIRRTLYPDEGLQQLLEARGRIDSEDPEATARALYGDALQTLTKYRDGLAGRSEPELQQELLQVSALLKTIETKVADPRAALSAPAEFFQKTPLNPKLSGDQIEALRNFSLELTEQCRQCHVVTDAAIQRVQKDQRVLRRAHFDHRAHILQRRCLDCHARIPIESKDAAKIAAADHADVQNLPGIETCRSCHNSRSATQRCSSCHYFHPDKEKQSSLLLYVDAPR